jgi:4'-phosphopantetheinyl transferase
MSLLSRQLLLKGLDELNQHLDQNTIWSETNEGRPYINSFPDFNLSHSGKIAVCAIGLDDVRVGIDIQMEKPITRQHLKQVFTNQELDWSCGEKDKIARIWSRKEALSKLIGQGMRINFKTLEALNNKISFEGRAYYLNTIPVTSGYQCSLAGETPLTINLTKYCWSSLTKLEKSPIPSINCSI